MALKGPPRRALLFAVLLVPVGATAQSVPKVSLKPANAKLDAEFTQIGMIRELSDGRLLVTDARETRLVVVDFRAATVEGVGRVGEGPGEYSEASRLFAISGDSTLMPDGNGGRWLLLDGARFVATLPPDRSPVGSRFAMLAGTDVRGNVLAAVVRQPSGGTPVPIGDSLVLVNIARATSRGDTLSRVRSPYGPDAVSMGGFVAVALRRADPSGPVGPGFFLTDRALMFPDAWVAIARLEPYHVEWRTSEGRTIRGAPLSVQQTKLDDREKQAILDRRARATGRPATPLDRIVGWPATVPAFEGAAPNVVLAAPDGKLWIARMPTVAQPGSRYDIVDRRGVLVGQVTLPENERIAGFGVKSVYVAVTDDDGIQRLQRHPWP